MGAGGRIRAAARCRRVVAGFNITRRWYRGRTCRFPGLWGWFGVMVEDSGLGSLVLAGNGVSSWEVGGSGC